MQLTTLLLSILVLFFPSNVFGQTTTKTILCLGDSLTAGYGVAKEQSYPSLLQNKLTRYKLPYKVINAGVSGDTSAGGLRRLGWLLKQSSPDIVILELGANDGLRGFPVRDTRKNLKSIISKFKSVNPKVKILLAGMQIPPNMGPQYANEFREMFPSLARETNSSLIPFFLEGVAAQPHLNLPDGIHPTADGYKVVARTVWKYVSPHLTRK